MRVAISPSLKQMGLLIHTSFQTPEGFSITSAYCRIIEVIFRPYTGGQYTLSFRMEFHVDRSARLNGRNPIKIPNLGDGQTYVGTLGDMAYLYGVLKTNLEEAGFTVEDIIDPPPPEPVVEEAPPPVPAEQPPAETPPS